MTTAKQHWQQRHQRHAEAKKSITLVKILAELEANALSCARHFFNTPVQSNWFLIVGVDYVLEKNTNIVITIKWADPADNRMTTLSKIVTAAEYENWIENRRLFDFTNQVE